MAVEVPTTAVRLLQKSRANGLDYSVKIFNFTLEAKRHPRCYVQFVL